MSRLSDCGELSHAKRHKLGHPGDEEVDERGSM